MIRNVFLHLASSLLREIAFIHETFSLNIMQLIIGLVYYESIFPQFFHSPFGQLERFPS